MIGAAAAGGGGGVRSCSSRTREIKIVDSSFPEVEDAGNEDTESGAVSAVLSVEDGGMVTVEEFPRVETEIVSRREESSGPGASARGRRGGRLDVQGEVITTLDLSLVGDAGRRPTDSSSYRRRGAARRFSLFHWFRGKQGVVGEISESNNHQPNGAGGNKATNERATNQLELIYARGKTVETVTRNEGSAAAVDVAAANTVSRNSTLLKCNSSLYSSSGSVDTTCSTATVHSFTFLQPGDTPSIIDGVNKSPSSRRAGRFHCFRDFRKHSSAEDFGRSVDRRCAGSPCDGEGTVNFHGEKENREPETGSPRNTPYHYRSLPTSGKNADLAARKTNNKVHVRGKRRAPNPPGGSVIAPVETRNQQKSGNTGRRNKRRAPNPPSETIAKTCDVLKRSEFQGAGERPRVVSNDTLKLEGGLLLPTRLDLTSEKKSVAMNHDASLVDKKTSPLVPTPLQVQAPRPWYKRSNTTLSDRDCGSFRREVLKIPTLSKNRGGAEKTARFSLHHEAQSSNSDSGDTGTFSRLNHFFGRTTERREQVESSRAQKRGDEKRRSNLSILTNISELDREAAAIVQEEQARNQAVLARSSGLFTDGSGNFERPPSGDIISDMVSSSIEPQRKGTRALISKFNAISNITKVTVNATFFTKSSNQSGKIDVVRGEPVHSSNVNSRNSERIVTKRLLYDGAEQVNETGVDMSSINFFRRLEAADAAQTRDDIHLGSQRSAPGWEEKIKRYFPERTSADLQSQKLQARKSAPLSNKQRQSARNDLQGNKRTEQKIVTEKYLPPNTSVAEQHLSRADLKEMLIEMKHSLPKRPKPKSGVKSVPVSIGNNDNKMSVQQTNIGKAQQRPTTAIGTSGIHQGEGQGIRGVKPLVQNQQSRPMSSTSNYTRSSISAGKRDQQGSSGAGMVLEKTKVSSGVQTSANLRKVGNYTTRELSPVINRVRSSPKLEARKSEDANHVTNGTKSPGRGTGLTRTTFQLIRPRDFACIEALKTEKTGAVNDSGQNTYMNVIEDSLYANTVISPSKSIADEPAGEGKTGSGSAAEEKINIVRDNKHENVQHYTASVVAQVKVAEEITQPEVTSTTVKKKEDAERPISETNMNTLAINRLLRKLEGAIASGQHQQAAGLAKELAQLKIHCSVVRQRSEKTKESDIINVDMYIEDKLAHQGPIPLQLSLSSTVTELKKKVFAEFEIPVNVQRWIIGKNLADNDDFTLEELKAVDKSSIFLYLVAPDLQNDECTRVDKIIVKEETTSPIEAPVEEQSREIEPIIEEKVQEITPQEPTVEELKLKRYEHLMSLENSDVIPNSVPIECPICFAPYGPCEGVILRDCLHMFCRTCIANTIMYCEEAEVKCPFRDSEYTCESTLQEREIKALVTSEVYEQHLAKSVSQAENNAGNNAFHCKTPDCPGWCIYDDNVNVFLCPVCGVNNCLTCQAIHTNKNCREYQDEIRLLKETDQETKRTAAVLEEMVESGEALACPTCAVVLMKKWGCDWLRCSMCKTEICWVTRGPRWGPGGKGDTSGGCKCGENGVKCHPRCNYCH